ncbi:MAG: protein-L-isoaspartate(D-aspartate) O-methyltransferase [Clostridia bacterium]|nr:protein-L-isoaspartate(D-aspartate) O-methyltransferase [Clostridia bacterium]
MTGILLVAALIVVLVGCVPEKVKDNRITEDISEDTELDVYASARIKMIEKDIQGKGISDRKVLDAMGEVKRHLFVDDDLWSLAYGDHPLPIDEGQTISQPYIVALMTETLKVEPGDKVLEIGTGSGYQAAVLAELTDYVYSIEIKELLVDRARSNLDANGYLNVKTKQGDGYFGWEEHAPFDAIIITCAVNHIPTYLLKQLKDGGRLILPLGEITYYQKLTLITKKGEEMMVTYIGDVRFVPMTGEALKSE